MVNTKKPIKIVYLQKLANQSMSDGAKISTFYFMKTKKSLFVRQRGKRLNFEKIER